MSAIGHFFRLCCRLYWDSLQKAKSVITLSTDEIKIPPHLMVVKRKGFPKFVTLNVEHISLNLPPWKIVVSFSFQAHEAYRQVRFSEAKLVYPWDCFLQCCIWIIKCYGRATWVYHHGIIDHCLDKNLIFFVRCTVYIFCHVFVCLFLSH